MDLYRVLSLVNLRIPPLRGRPGDIVFLAERFLEKIGHGTGTSRTLSRETLQMLETYQWPENTRELEIVITQACASATGPKVEIDHLPQSIQASFQATKAERSHAFTTADKKKRRPLKDVILPIATMEQRAILKALEQTGGDRVMAAKLLGIGKTTMYRKLKEYKDDIHLNTAPSNLICA